ncbi:MAG: hypothetical protein QOD77_1390 [Thermoplasmata archaeon]|jgi:hypothetical protein|nr:hypothetical protein [Thermoplasmata archaeon]
MARPVVPAVLSALFLAAVAAPGGLASAGDYCVDSSCPYHGLPVQLQITVDYSMVPDRQVEGTCYPVEGTGDRPGIKMYPVLNMIVVNNCVFRDGVLEDGPLVGTVLRDARYGVPATVTVTEEGEEDGVEAHRVVCLPLGGSGSGSGPRVQVYSGMTMYELDACRIDWASAASGGPLKTYLTVSPIGA